MRSLITSMVSTVIKFLNILQIIVQKIIINIFLFVVQIENEAINKFLIYKTKCKWCILSGKRCIWYYQGSYQHLLTSSQNCLQKEVMYRLRFARIRVLQYQAIPHESTGLKKIKAKIIYLLLLNLKGLQTELK